MTLKPAETDKDFELIGRLAAIIWHETYDNMETVGKEMTDYMLLNYQSSRAVKDQTSQGYKYFILFDGKKAAGYTAYKPDPDCIFMSKAYILSECRGKGGFSSIVELLVKAAKDNGKPCIELCVNRKNLRAQSAYKKAGFEIIGEVNNDLGGGFMQCDYRLRKTI